MKKIQKIIGLSVGRKLLLAQIASIVVMILALTLIAGMLIKSRYTANSYLQLAALNMRIIDMIDVYNMNLKQNAESLGRVLTQYNTQPGKRMELSQENIDRFTSTTGAVATLFVKKGDDFLRVSTSLRKEDGTKAVGTLLDRNHPGYKKVLAGESYTGPAILFGRNYMTNYTPIMIDNLVIGIHFIGVDFTEGVKNLKQKIRTIKVGETGYVYVVEGGKSKDKGKFLVHVSNKLEGAQMINLKDANGREFVKEIVESPNGVMSYSWMEEERNEISAVTKLSAHTNYDQWNWIIVSNAREDELLSDGYALRNSLFMGFLICCALILAVLYFTVKIIIVTRFRLLTAILKDLSEGEGDLTVRLSFKEKDEIGEIAIYLNRFLEDLEKMIADIVMAGQSLVHMVENIHDGNQSLSQRTSEQASSLEEIASTIEEAMSTINMNAENSQKARRFSEEGSVQAGEGNSVANAAVDSINEINQSSKKIAETVSVIHEIAFQTNLLALNAAVEAARAGQHGSGFSVVAQEVRNLAQRSSNAAKEIEVIIQDSISKVEHGTSMVLKTGTVLKEISGSSKKIAGLITEISTSSEMQRTGMMQINNAISEMDSATQQNAALVEETASASDEMADRAHELLRMIKRFKISGDGNIPVPEDDPGDIANVRHD